MVSALAEIIFLCSGVKLHRCHAAKALLVPLGIIEMDIFFDGEKPTHLLPQDVVLLYF